MSNVVKEQILDKEPGMGINANPFEAEIYLDLTSPLGKVSGQYYSLMFQMGKNGFATFKMAEEIDVSPSFKQYYDLTIQQSAALEAQLKAGLAQISNAIHDYELISHDLRKYREYLDYFTKIEEGDKLIKSKKKEDKEKGEPMKKEGVQLLKSMFIDQVDAHTGEGIALRTITQRWPTIIVDFMRLDDKDIDQKGIAKKYEMTEAEGAVLATKNKLFLEWRDQLFKPTLKERYQNILRLTEARRASIQRYTEMLKPVAARFKLINDSLEQKGGRNSAIRDFFQPGSQAYSIDSTRIWAFLPFAPAEKYKVTREFLEEIPATRAGFTKAQIAALTEKQKEEYVGGKKNIVSALPVEPSIDDIVWRYVEKIEDHYNVKLTIADIFEARHRLVNLFKSKSSERVGGLSPSISSGNTWLFSPYYVFLDIPFLRVVIRLPNGSELENLMLRNMTVKNRTQNVVIVTLLEVIAREKQLENYISQLLGEVGVTNPGEAISEFDTIENLAKKQYPAIFETEEEKKKTPEQRKKEEKKKLKELNPTKKVKNTIGDFLNLFGLKFDWLRARGDYEFAMDDRLAEMFQLEAAFQGYLYVLRYLQQGAGVPGVKV